MAVFNWTALNNNQTIGFNPAVDVLNFNDGTIAAADLQLTLNSGASPFTRFSVGGKTVTLQSDARTITTTNVVFADRSELLIGDNATATTNDDSANTIVGGDGDDQ